ncbi:MAG: hypothetical protein ACTSO7_00700 [Candidatus Heimdallarchaeota archaeon]
MNKKFLTTMLILSCVLSLTFVIKPNVVSAAQIDLLTYDPRVPVTTIYHEDSITFGGTIFNNQTITFTLEYLVARFYNPENKTIIDHSYTYELSTQVARNELAPNEARTVSFTRVIGDELPSANNYTLKLVFGYYQKETTTTTPHEMQVGESIDLNVEIKRPPAPTYIYAVFVILIVTIVAIVVVSIVSWIKERRSK